MKSLFACAIVLVCVSSMRAQFVGDVLGAHDLSPNGKSPIQGGLLPPCQYCHAPHSGIGKGPLWGQKYSTQAYKMYSSTTIPQLETFQQPATGGPSSLCLSCHDGTVAPGTTQPYGSITMQGKMNQADILDPNLDGNLQGSHPFSFNNLQDSADLVAGLVTSHQTADPLHKVHLVRGNVECESCHNPHVQNLDQASLNFLVRDSSSGQMCLACHGTTVRTVNNLSNPLTLWPTSIHATTSNSTLPAANVGPYATVAQNACSSCHVDHNANGTARLLRGPVPALVTMDVSTQNCITCHNGTSNVSPAPPNVYAEISKTTGHPLPALSGNNMHNATVPPPPTGLAEAVLLNSNRHSTCVDCHNPHAAQQVPSTFPIPPQIRASQNGVAGVQSDGITLDSGTAQYQYENCLRCHGSSTGKGTLAIQSTFGYFPVRSVVSATDPLNVSLEFSSSATSSHPVTHDRSSVLPQPSLLTNMLKLDGVSQGRAMGVRIFCTDCHNSDDNREFGGAGPNGPHGSIYPHVLERRYEMSTVSGGPGSLITNLYPGLQIGAGGATANPGPWALCGKCHNLATLLNDNSVHAMHVTNSLVGASCSVCHTAHGMGTTSPTMSGTSLVNFDTNVVATNSLGPTGPAGISYNSANSTCVLVCHGVSHNYDGTITQLSTGQQLNKSKPRVHVGR
jgi:predicted CXXCH cytochrome family protein